MVQGGLQGNVLLAPQVSFSFPEREEGKASKQRLLKFFLSPAGAASIPVAS